MKKQVKANKKLAKESAANNAMQAEQEIKVPEDQITDSADVNPEPQKAQDTADYPPGVTQEGQHPEHMDLRFLNGNNELIERYLNVSDDDGQYIGDKNLENQVKSLTNLLLGVDGVSLSETDVLNRIDKHEELFLIIEEITPVYENKVSFNEACNLGLAAKQRIRQGMLLNLQKILFKKIKGKGESWIEYIKGIYGPNAERSIQVYMALAKIPNVIRYAVLGMDRLLQIKRVAEEFKNSVDPVANFLTANDIAVDFDSEGAFDQLKLTVDAAVAVKKIENKCMKKGVQVSIDQFLMLGALEKSDAPNAETIVRQCTFLGENGGDVNGYLDRRFLNGGETEGIEERDVDNYEKIVSFQKLVATMKTTVDYMIQKKLVTENLTGHINDLENKVAELRALIPQQSTAVNNQ